MAGKNTGGSCFRRKSIQVISECPLWSLMANELLFVESREDGMKPPSELP